MMSTKTQVIDRETDKQNTAEQWNLAFNRCLQHEISRRKRINSTQYGESDYFYDVTYSFKDLRLYAYLVMYIFVQNRAFGHQELHHLANMKQRADETETLISESVVVAALEEAVRLEIMGLQYSTYTTTTSSPEKETWYFFYCNDNFPQEIPIPITSGSFMPLGTWEGNKQSKFFASAKLPLTLEQMKAMLPKNETKEAKPFSFWSPDSDSW